MLKSNFSNENISVMSDAVAVFVRAGFSVEFDNITGRDEKSFQDNGVKYSASVIIDGGNTRTGRVELFLSPRSFSVWCGDLRGVDAFGDLWRRASGGVLRNEYRFTSAGELLTACESASAILASEYLQKKEEKTTPKKATATKAKKTAATNKAKKTA